MASPLLVLFTSSVVIGLVATLIVVVAVFVDSWQFTSFSHNRLVQINGTCTNGQMSCKIYQISSDPSLYRYVEYANPQAPRNFTVSKYLYSTHSGLWKICNDLNYNLRNDNIRASESNFNGKECFTFVTDYNEDSELLTDGSKQIARLQNSAASCYIVVIIDLSSAAVVGIIGIVQKQVASCMVTGVLYLMAALFGVFGLSMFHTKDYYEKYQCYSLDEVPEPACSARDVDIGYAVPMAWTGVVACALACSIWLCVSRALRVIKAKTML